MAGTKSVQLQTLTCHRTNDGPRDEAYLLYNGQEVFGPVSINDGQSRDIGVTKPIEGQARVSLFDEDDTSSDDAMGTITISANEKGQRFQTLTGSGARYTLFYQIVTVTPQ